MRIIEIDDKFTVKLEPDYEDLSQSVLQPRSVNKLGRPADYTLINKKRSFLKFHSLVYKKNTVFINDLFYFIEFMEVLKAYFHRSLEKNKLIEVKNEKCLFFAEVVQKEKRRYLKLSLPCSIKDDNTVDMKNLYMDRFEAASLYSKFYKVLSRCEPV